MLQKKCVRVFSRIIFNHSALWPGQQELVPFSFAVVVFSSLCVLTNMTVIAILSTNYFPLISMDGFHGPCGVAVISHGLEMHQNPPSVTAHRQERAGAGHVLEGLCSAELGVLAKENRIKIPLGLLPTNTTRHLFSLWSAPVPGSAMPCSRAAHADPTGARSCPRRGAHHGVLCASSLGKTTKAPVRDQGLQRAQKWAFPWSVFPVSPRRCSRRGD